LSQTIDQALVEFPLIQVRRKVALISFRRGLARRVPGELAERPLDALPLVGQKLAGAVGIHTGSVSEQLGGARQVFVLGEMGKLMPQPRQRP